VPEGVTRVHLPPGQDFALVERSGAGLGILHLVAGKVNQVVAVEGAMAQTNWVAFSLAAGSAVLCSSSSGRLQVLNGLPDAAHVAMELDTTTLPEPPRTAAVSDDGQTLLVASARSVYRVGQDGSAQLLKTGREIVSIAIVRNGLDAVVWDGGAGSIHYLQNVSSAPVDRLLASGLKGFGKLYPSWDGETLFLARLETKGVSSIDVASGEIQVLDSAVVPLTLEPLHNRDTFLISGRPHQPAWIFYRDGSSGRVVFVPAADQMTESGQ
jgi:hypothetical protein